MPTPEQPAASPSDPGARRLVTPELLDGLAQRPLYEHAEVYQGLHEELQVALTEIDGA